MFQTHRDFHCNISAVVKSDVVPGPSPKHEWELQPVTGVNGIVTGRGYYCWFPVDVAATHEDLMEECRVPLQQWLQLLRDALDANSRPRSRSRSKQEQNSASSS